MLQPELVVGLGNPGSDYDRTYHNVGFAAIDYLSNHSSVERTIEDHGQLLKLEHRCVGYLAKPGTYVNRSGVAVRAWCEKYDIPPENLLIIYDDFQLDVGRIRIRPSGSAGGHNGMADIISQLETEKIPRLRVGIGPVPEGMDPVEFVLMEMSERDDSVIIGLLRSLPEILETMCEQGLSNAMNRWNGVDFRGRS